MCSPTSGAGCALCALWQTVSQKWCTLQEIGAEAADLGINIGLEIINRYETNILNTAAQVQIDDVIDKLGGPVLTSYASLVPRLSRGLIRDPPIRQLASTRARRAWSSGRPSGWTTW